MPLFICYLSLIFLSCTLCGTKFIILANIVNCTKLHDPLFLHFFRPQILNFVRVVIHRPQILTHREILDQNNGMDVLKIGWMFPCPLLNKKIVPLSLPRTEKGTHLFENAHVTRLQNTSLSQDQPS